MMLEARTIEGSNDIFTPPRISVTINNYNHGKYLAQSIESVLMQTYENFELILVDDGSTDNSLDIMCYYREMDARIKTHVFESNQGADKAVAKALDLASGVYLFPRAADDWLTDSAFFEKAMDAMRLYPEAAGVYGASVIVDGTTDQPTMIMGQSVPRYISPEDARCMFLDHKLMIPGASSIWKRDKVDQVGGFDPLLGPQSDYYINHVLPMKHGVVALGQQVAAVRRFDDAWSKLELGQFARRHDAVHKKMRAAIPELDHDGLWHGWLKGCGVSLDEVAA